MPLAIFEQLVKTGTITALQDKSAPTFSSEALEHFRRAGRHAYREANRRADFVRAHLRGEILSGPPIKERTLRMWAAAYRAAEAKWGCGYLGLLPAPHPGKLSDFKGKKNVVLASYVLAFTGG